MDTFDGQADYTLDAKNRLTVPARYRASLGDDVVLAKAAEPCVAIWPRQAYDDFRSAALQGAHPMSRQAAQIKRFYAANSQPVELDKAGRVPVPSFLIEHAGIEREVTVIGAEDHLEIWDRAAWAQYNEKLTEDILTMSMGFDDLPADAQ